MAMDETQIISSLKNGKPEDFAFLYDVYVEKIYNYFFRRTFHKQTSEDLTSVTFIKALDKIGSFDAREGSFQSWLFGIARNNLIDHYRKTVGAVALEEIQNLPSSENLQKHISSKYDLDSIRKALESLTELQREVVTLRVWEGLTHREIASALGISEASAKVTFSRAVNQLKNL